MSTALLTRPANADNIRKEIAALEQEVDSARIKRNGIVEAIAKRQVKINRLKAQLELNAPHGTALPSMR